MLSLIKLDDYVRELAPGPIRTIPIGLEVVAGPRPVFVGADCCLRAEFVDSMSESALN